MGVEKEMMKFSRKLRTILGLLAVILLVGTAVFLIWASNPLGPMPEAEAALQSDDQVTVSLDPWIAFYPADTAVTTVLPFPTHWVTGT